MSTQYKDGTFSDIEPLPEAMGKFMEAVEAGQAKSLLVGTQEEIQRQQFELANAERVDDLAQRVADLEAAQSRTIAVPTTQEVEKYAGGEVAK